jgi:hypothetical protein
VAHVDRALSRHAVWLLTALVLGCLLTGSAVAFLHSRSFKTHDQAIGFILTQNDIVYEQIRLSHTWPDTMNSRAYAADVIVRLPGTRQITGRIDCKVRRSQCFLYLRRLGIWREPVPDLVTTPLWLTRLQRTLFTLGGLARDLLNS